MGVRLSVAVAHHPARADHVAELVAAVGGRVHVRTDPEPERMDAWLNAKEAWRWAVGRPSTHHLVLEDDVVVCADFRRNVTRALAARPDAVVRFYVASHPGLDRDRYQRAAQAGERWVYADPRCGFNWGGAQALAIPTPMVEDMLFFAEAHPELGKYPDVRIQQWTVSRKLPVWATIPSLVDHADLGSLSGERHHRAFLFHGQAPGRPVLNWRTPG